MATETTKRKRGRPAGASRAADASAPQKRQRRQRQTDGEEAEATTAADRPRKRARKSRDGEEEQSSPHEGRKSGRGRNSGEAAHTGKKKRGRPSLTGPGDASSSTAAKPKRGRGRPSLQSLQAAGEDAPPPPTTEKRRPGRPRKLDASSTAAETPASSRATQPRKRGRPRTSDAAAATPASNERRRRASLEGEGIVSAQNSKKGATRRRRSAQREQQDEQNEDGDEDEDGEEEEDEGQQRRTADSAAAAQLPFGQLVPRTRLVPLATMEKTWAPLDREAVAAVLALLADCARPVLARPGPGGSGGGSGAREEERQEQARQAIAGVTRRLRSKLVKGIPFPPATVAEGKKPTRPKRSSRGLPVGIESDFHFERAAAGVQALERQLDPLQHAVALLRNERAREEQALEDDYAALRQLEANATAELRAWRKRTARAHALAPAADDGEEAEGGELQLPLELVKPPTTAGDDPQGGIFENLDKDLLALSTQLGNHMDSLKANLQQIDGVVPAMARSKAALQQVLHRHLEPQQYERIILGL